MARTVWLVLLSLALFSPAGPGLAQKWVVHQPRGAGFKVEFPVPPRSDSRELTSPSRPARLYTSFVNQGRRAFAANRTVFQLGTLTSGLTKHLDAGRDAMLQSNHGQLREERRLTVGGAPARRIVLDMPAQEQVMVSLLVIKDDVFYQLIYVGPNGTETSADAKRFFSSFKLLGR